MRRIIIGWIVAVLLVPSAWAGDEPLWEAGLGFGIMTLPDYRGSDQNRLYVLPIPYLSYHGDKVRVDRGGVHGDLVRTNRAVLDLSMSLGPPVKSNDNTARAGMPNIAPTVEAGPSLEWLLSENDKHDRKVMLRLPARAVLTSRGEYIGWVFSPHLNLDVLNLGPSGGWNFGAAIGPLYASEKYNDYYYQVDPQYVTSTRAAYDAKGGYSGARITLALSKRFPQYWVGAFMRYDSLSHAVFESSPLVRREHAFMAGVGVSWIFIKSEERVQVDRRLDTVAP